MKAWDDEAPRGIPARLAPKERRLGDRLTAALAAKHVAVFAKRDLGDAEGHARIPPRFQATGASSVAPMAATSVPKAKNRTDHPASAPHAPHSRKVNRR